MKEKKSRMKKNNRGWKKKNRGCGKKKLRMKNKWRMIKTIVDEKKKKVPDEKKVADQK